MHIKLIASAAATLLTLASIDVVTANLPMPAAQVAANGTSIVTLAPVLVHANAADRRAAALLTDIEPTPGLITTSAADNAAGERPRLLRSAAAMPYYSFGNTLGRINQE